MTIDNELLEKKASLNRFSQYKGSRNEFQPRDVSKSLSVREKALYEYLWLYLRKVW